MKVELHILNEKEKEEPKDWSEYIGNKVVEHTRNIIEHRENAINNKQETNNTPEWYMRHKSYETDHNFIDDDVISCPIGHKLDRLLLDDIQITSFEQIDKIIELLQNAKPCFK